jgi:hypothetical protein
MTAMEEKILKLAKFVMAFQKAYVERLYGSDFQVTWDANLLHHVVAPIADAVYSAHSDYSPLLCFLKNDYNTHVVNDSDVYLPNRDNMQVLTIYCSNHLSSGSDHCTTITYSYGKKKIDSANLGSRGVHIQGPGSQSMGVKHEVTVDPKAHQAGIYQCICTTRLSVVPRSGPIFEDSIRLEQGSVNQKETNNVRTVKCYDQTRILLSISNNQTSMAESTLESVSVRKKLITCPTMETIPTRRSTPTQQEENLLQSFSAVKPDVIDDSISKSATKNSISIVLSYAEIYPKVPKEIYAAYKIQFHQPKMAWKDCIKWLTSGPA